MAPGQRQSIPVPIGHRYLFKRFSTKLGGHLLKPLPFIMKRVWTLQRAVLLSFRKLYFATIGPLHDPVTWHKIKNTGEQVAQWDFQNNAPAFVLEVPLRDLLTSICNFVPCDQVVKRAYCEVAVWHLFLLSSCSNFDSEVLWNLWSRDREV